MQERRQRYFIDEDKNKVKRNNSFVNSNLNSNAFFSECDKHQRKQAILHENMLKCNRDILFIKL